MLRCQIYVGTILKLLRVEEPAKIKNIIFKKEINFKTFKNFVACDLISGKIYPYFSGKTLSDWNFKYYHDIQLEEGEIVTNGYSLNSYLKNRGYPFILNDEHIINIINEEINLIKGDVTIGDYILYKENMNNLDSEKEKYLSFK